jgi:anti-sigma factor RsiW
MDDHPERDELHAFAQGKLPREQAGQVVSHILGCEPCREETARLNLWHLRQLRERRRRFTPGADEDEGRSLLTGICLPILEAQGA